MSSLAGESSARMVGDLCYVAAQASALMVAAVDRVYHAGANKRQLKAALEDQVATLEDRSERLEDQWMLEKWVVHVIEKVIESAKFSSGIRGVGEAYEVLDPGNVARRVAKVDTALSSLAEMDFASLFRLGELDYEGFRQFCGRPNLGGSFSDSEG
ncbi:unnamed protein product [Lactuca saligna]|uniref:Uncharacterized protein n=1 Tax=Lactuca saligna TaxID=75948 RepID=A0AA36E789_LACSI|nr:unnamed protein product [Lactuca saligna]